jgi:hypothetical protein
MGGADVQIPIFLTLELVEGEWSVSCSYCFILGKQPWYPLEKEAGWAPDLVWGIWRCEDS